ncbi:MAG: acyltransferase domain-containing protein [Micrococcales bacterium]|nr:acyltransferase domain-containing protein [Micrococcales bacterium]MCL2666831.1 acyltransferase domain-containing protein [Micrococcales bacterium]
MTLPEIPLFASGGTPEELTDSCVRTATTLTSVGQDADERQVLEDLCAHTALATHGRYRAVVLADNVATAASRLEAVGRADTDQHLTLRSDRMAHGSVTGDEKVAFLYPGQGGQCLAETAEIAAVCQRYAAQVRDLENQYGDARVVEALSSAWPDRSGSLDVTGTAVAQPMLAVVAMAMTDLLVASGVRPTVAAGHSVGEFGALYAAGALTASDVVTVVRERVGCMTGAVQGTAMMALAGDPHTWSELVDSMPEVHLACENSTGQVVVGGQRSALEALAADLAPTGTRCHMLSNEGAFHTPHFDEAEVRFRQRVGESGITGTPQLSATLVSSVSGETVATGAEGLDLVLHQISSPVKFTSVLRHLGQTAPDVVVQMSGGTFLLSWTQGVPGLERCVKIGFGGPNATARSLATTVGQLFLSVRDFSPAVVYGGIGVASRAVRSVPPLHSVLDTSDRRDHPGQMLLRRRMVKAMDPQVSFDAPEPAPVDHHSVLGRPAGVSTPHHGVSHRSGLATGVLAVIERQNEVITALMGPHGTADRSAAAQPDET